MWLCLDNTWRLWCCFAFIARNKLQFSGAVTSVCLPIFLFFPPSSSISPFCSHPSKFMMNVDPSEYSLCFAELLSLILHPFVFLCGDFLVFKSLHVVKSGQIILQNFVASILSQFAYQMKNRFSFLLYKFVKKPVES